jgi:lambda repressor-like predicted transcriptional regulator
MSLVELASQIGLDRRTVQRVATRTWIRRDAADRLAIALGRHPSEIWLNWFPGDAR